MDLADRVVPADNSAVKLLARLAVERLGSAAGRPAVADLVVAAVSAVAVGREDLAAAAAVVVVVATGNKDGARKQGVRNLETGADSNRFAGRPALPCKIRF